MTGLRFFTAYGPRNRPDLAIAKFAALIERGEPVPMFGDGTTRRDYTYVGDIVDGIVRAVDRCTAHHLYNLGNSDPIELRDDDRRRSARRWARPPASSACPSSRATSGRPTPTSPAPATSSAMRPRTPFREGLDAVRRLVPTRRPAVSPPERRRIQPAGPSERAPRRCRARSATILGRRRPSRPAGGGGRRPGRARPAARAAARPVGESSRATASPAATLSRFRARR